MGDILNLFDGASTQKGKSILDQYCHNQTDDPNLPSVNGARYCSYIAPPDPNDMILGGKVYIYSEYKKESAVLTLILFSCLGCYDENVGNDNIMRYNITVGTHVGDIKMLDGTYQKAILGPGNNSTVTVQFNGHPIVFKWNSVFSKPVNHLLDGSKLLR